MLPPVKVMIGVARKVSFSSYSMSSGYKLLFSGQGSQYVGMTGRLPSPLPPQLRELFAKSLDILGYDVREYCLNGPQELLSRTVYCQPAVVMASLAAYKSLDEQV